MLGSFGFSMKGDMDTIIAKNGAPLGMCAAHRNWVEKELLALLDA
jgi:hypothetical protein